MSVSRPSLLPLGALAAGVGLSLLSPTVVAQADAAPPAVEVALPNVTVKAKADKTPEAKQSYQATTTRVGKGKQAIRDIPQSMTVVTGRCGPPTKLLTKVDDNSSKLFAATGLASSCDIKTALAFRSACCGVDSTK